MTGLPDEAARLFREDPGRFVAARDALVTELRDQGRADEAAAVKSLRRPTAVVWALNQLSQRDAAAVGALLEAGAELRAAQQATLSTSSGGADRLRPATAARRAAVSALAELGADLLEAQGHGARPDEITSALEAASVDEEAGARLAAGTLERPPAPVSGFGDVFGLTAVPGGGEAAAATKRRRSSSRRGSSAETSEASAAEVADAESEVAARRRDRDAAARRARTARETAERLRHRADGMRERLAAADAEHADAETRAGGADLEAARAERELTTAQEQLETLQRKS